mmetsp:Transcript_27149/g.68481  ORF Transcript_27149/g.68481 Transcript_27149/m.68481 type:complete len:292 (+) Transcript_27149:1204-2079(+)
MPSSPRQLSQTRRLPHPVRDGLSPSVAIGVSFTWRASGPILSCRLLEPRHRWFSSAGGPSLAAALDPVRERESRPPAALQPPVCGAGQRPRPGTGPRAFPRRHRGSPAVPGAAAGVSGVPRARDGGAWGGTLAPALLVPRVGGGSVLARGKWNRRRNSRPDVRVLPGHAALVLPGDATLESGHRVAAAGGIGAPRHLDSTVQYDYEREHHSRTTACSFLAGSIILDGPALRRGSGAKPDHGPVPAVRVAEYDPGARASRQRAPVWEGHTAAVRAERQRQGRALGLHAGRGS